MVTSLRGDVQNYHLVSPALPHLSLHLFLNRFYNCNVMLNRNMNHLTVGMHARIIMFVCAGTL
jgi:hypothetical protein